MTATLTVIDISISGQETDSETAIFTALRCEK